MMGRSLSAEIEMSHITERSEDAASKAVDQVKNIAASAATSAGDAANYVREHDAEDMGRDVMRAAKEYPIASLLVMGAVVVGGAMLVATMLRDEGSPGASERSRRVMGLASASSGLGPKGIETLSRIRDAAFSFVFDKAVDTVNEMWPGFREHYERG
jgi:hypothetical protein